MLKRLPLLLAVLAAGIFTSSTPGRARTAPSVQQRLVQAAAARLAHESSGTVVTWLRRQRTVRSARLGPDHQTIDIRFRDGRHSAILPARLDAVSVQPGSRSLGLREMARTDQQASGRAVVLEPFATELSLGPGAGDIEVHDLQSAGFQVDQAYDTVVTVASMASLSRYNVVYMHTHSGPLPGSDAALATGQTANGDPSVTPLIGDGSVITVGVAGCTNCYYYAITSHFVQYHMGTFPHDSLLFLNGCQLLPSNLFWGALQSKGAGVMLSWDNDAAASDDFLSAAAFFNQMGTGLTVAGALKTLYAANYGKSQYQGQTATLGYRGDGTITLVRAGGKTGSATSTPTAVPPTATPTPTTLPTATPTSAPTSIPRLPLTATLSNRIVPGARQVIAVHSAPNTQVHVRITFPNGDIISRTAKTNAAGVAQISYRQGASKVTHANATATVAIEAGTGLNAVTLTRQYSIAFATIDVSAEPRAQSPGGSVTIWIHTHAHARVLVVVTLPHQKGKQLSGSTGPGGWTHVRYTLSRTAPRGASVTVAAHARVGGRSLQTKTTIKIV